MNTPFEFLNSTIQITPGRRVVKAQEFDQFVQANDVLAFAKQQVKTIEAQAVQAYEDRRLEGYKDGLSQVDDEKAVFCMQVAQDFAGAISDIEDKLASLLPKIIRNLLGDIGYDTSFKAYISRALQDIINEKRVVIKVHPSQRGLIEEHLKNRPQVASEITQYIRVASDSTLDKDQATLETASSIVVLDLKRQLDLLEEYTTQKLKDDIFTLEIGKSPTAAMLLEPASAQGQGQKHAQRAKHLEVDTTHEDEEIPLRVYES